MTYPSTGIAAKAINGSHTHIGECCRGKLKSYKGYIWKYKEDIVSTSNEN
nr:MAG TPA: Intron encoded nuclease repeat motif [Caudoviricetes sp.]